MVLHRPDRNPECCRDVSIAKPSRDESCNFPLPRTQHVEEPGLLLSWTEHDDRMTQHFAGVEVDGHANVVRQSIGERRECFSRNASPLCLLDASKRVTESLQLRLAELHPSKDGCSRGAGPPIVTPSPQRDAPKLL